MGRRWRLPIRPVTVLVLATLQGAAGCGGAPAPAPSAPPVGPPTAPVPTWQRSDDPLAGRMRDLATQLEQANLAVGVQEGTGFLAAQENRAVPLDVAPNRCLTIVAVAATGLRDLDATAYEPSGDVLAADEEPDAHPTLQICAGSDGRRIYYGLSAYEGAGPYLFATFVSEPSALEGAANVLGGRPGVATVGDDGPGGEGRLRAVADGIGRRGFRRHGPPVTLTLAPGQQVRVPLSVNTAHCYTVAALGTGPDGAVRRIAVRILDADDGEVGRDDGSEPDALAQICADADAEQVVEVRERNGLGTSVQIAFFVADATRVRGPSGLWLGSRPAEQLSDRALRLVEEEASNALAAGGWRAARQVARGRLAPGEARRLSVRLPGGRCTKTLMLGGPGLGRLALRLRDEAGVLLGDEVGPAPAVEIVTCPARTTRAWVVLGARRGAGEFAVVRAERSAVDLATAPAANPAAANP